MDNTVIQVVDGSKCVKDIFGNPATGKGIQNVEKDGSVADGSTGKLRMDKLAFMAYSLGYPFYKLK